jgi:hypothetical protein
MTSPGNERTTVDALIADLLASTAELADAAAANVQALREVLRPRPDGDSALGPDLLEIVTLQAQAAGMSVQDYLWEAVVAHIALSEAAADGDGNGRGRLEDARRVARRLLAENRAARDGAGSDGASG